MLTKEENELITLTGAGTPMGELFRRFWLPVMLAEEVPAPDCVPVRLRVMNEDLIAFKDTTGRVGIVDAYCPHRGSPMFFGRNEENGLRCVYHGWKFDTTGQCVEMPNAPEGVTFKDKVKIPAYPAVEKGGFIWCYMGPRELQPPLPQWEFMDIPESYRENWKIVTDCNWLQSMEGQNDPSHGIFLHSFVDPNSNPSLNIGIANNQAFQRLRLPELVEDTEYGVRWATVWDGDDGEKQVQIGHWVLPIFDPARGRNQGPQGGRMNLGYSRMRVPIDDETSMVLRVRWDPEKPLPPQFREAHNAWLIPEKIPGTYRPKANKSNDYKIDRVLQKNYTFTGINNFPLQDICVIEDQRGPIMDRTKEILNSADEINIHIRRQLIKAARELMQGKEPLAPHKPELFLVQSGSFNMPKDKEIKEVVEEALPVMVSVR
jgi:phthalate 4,5-dioxygenase oxygenase subunit